MSKTEAPHDTDHKPAVGGPVERMVRAPNPERAAFEAWWCKAYHPAALARDADGDYIENRPGAAWEAWQAARPKRPAVGSLINIAAELAQRKPIRALDVLSERSGRTLGRRAMDDAIEAAHDNLARTAMRISDAARAL